MDNRIEVVFGQGHFLYANADIISFVGVMMVISEVHNLL